MTDFRARGTIMGLTGLTAVFGMGTGVAPPVWSPEGNRRAVRPRRLRWFNRWSSRRQSNAARGNSVCLVLHQQTPTAAGSMTRGMLGDKTCWFHADRSPRCGGRIGVVKLSAVGTGPLRRSPAVHSQPIDLVVFQEPSHQVLETSS